MQPVTAEITDVFDIKRIKLPPLNAFLRVWCFFLFRVTKGNRKFEALASSMTS